MTKIDQDFLGEGGFFYDVFVATDDKAAVRAKRLWMRMGLPVPEEGEYLYGDHGVHVYLNPLGLSIHLRKRNFLQGAVFESRKVRHDNLLQPLYQRDLSEDASFEICPGVKRVGASKTVLDDLASRLDRHGLKFFDRQAGYIGVLPGVGKGKIVVANRSAVKCKAGSGNASMLAPQTQEKIFGGLAQQMQEAFKSASHAKIQSVFDACAKITSLKNGDSARILNASWTNAAMLGPRQPAIVASAAAYERKLTF